MGQTSLSLSDWHTNCVKVCMCVSSGCDTFEIELYLKQRGSVNFEKCEELLSTVCHPTFGQAALSNVCFKRMQTCLNSACVFRQPREV